MLVRQTGAVSLVIARWVDREAAAAPAQGSLFPFEKSHGKGDVRTGNRGGRGTDVGPRAGDWDSGSAPVGLEEDITHFRWHIQTV